MNWIPQNDLLAHRDIKAFVSHAGTNSYYESAYHGVPVVAVPLFVDHFSNARKAEYFGIATVLDHQTMNAEELSEAIQLVMNEPRYFEKNIATRLDLNAVPEFPQLSPLLHCSLKLVGQRTSEKFLTLDSGLPGFYDHAPFSTIQDFANVFSNLRKTKF